MMQTNPRDALPLAHRAAHRDDLRDRLHWPSSSVERRQRMYCQLGSADDGREFVTLSVHIYRTTRCDDRCAVAIFSKSRVWDGVLKGNTPIFGVGQISL